MSALRTEFEFVLPRGYLDEAGTLHKRGTMRLATARDELEPLRDPTITGPDDPRLTILVLTRVVQTLGTMVLVTPHEIEGLFAADLAYLQDFYGVINFGSDDDIESMLATQALPQSAPRQEAGETGDQTRQSASAAGDAEPPEAPERPKNRRAAIQEVPSSSR